ncbi:MAG: site-specific DNA-methyltransferase [Methylobacter sp.]
MEKLNLHSPDFTQANIAKLAELFPNCVTETCESDGTLKKSIDFDQLRQELSTAIVEGPQERYQLNWPGKREALLTANAPIAKTLRPCREESVDFDTTQNLFIEGDNLDALKLLQETYLGKVKMIYIDPPYNTGKEFIYDDDFSEDTQSYFQRSNQKDEAGQRMVANTESNGRFHSDWLSMMYPRLKLARNLLRDDGVIFISIDDNEQANLKRLCDEVFGEQNFVSTIVWEKRYSPQNAVKWFSESHDFVIVYAKDKLNWYPNLLERSDEMNARYRNLDNDPRGVWKPADSTAQGGHGTKSQFYILTAPNGKQHTLPNGRCWLYTEPVFQQMVADNRIWFGADGNNVPAVKRFLSEVKQGIACQTIWKYVDVGHNQEAKKEVNDLFPESSVFDTPKPYRLIKRILQISTDKNGIILDFFSGSATTAHAVMQLNAEDGGKRKFIMVQLPEACDEKSEAYKAGYQTIAEIGKERIRRAGQKIKRVGEALASTGAEKEELVEAKASPTASSTPTIDIGFRVLKIDSSNMKDVYYTPDAVQQGDLADQVDNIREGRSAEDLLFQVLLDWGVDLTLPITQETIAGLTVLFVDGNALAACFDTDINETFVKGLAARHPLRVVFRDAGFANDSVKINIEQIFKLLSPTTDIKTI